MTTPTRGFLQAWAATSLFGKKIERIIEIGGQPAPAGATTAVQSQHERALALKNNYERVAALPRWRQIFSLRRLFDDTETFFKDFPEATPTS